MTRLLDLFSSRQFAALQASYGKKWDVNIVLFDTEAKTVRGELPRHHDSAEVRRLIKKRTEEAIRWGDASFALISDGGMVWLVPVMFNMLTLGCVAAFLPAILLSVGNDSVLSIAVRDAAEELREWLEGENLTNGALLEMRHNQYDSERCRAEAIHEFKLSSSNSLLDAIQQIRTGTPVPQLRQAMEFMHKHLSRGISREEVARVVHLSPSHFSRIFKKTFKESFSARLAQMRTSRAAEMLSGTDESISAIAAECGFSDQSYFTKIFRKHQGKTPHEYRNYGKRPDISSTGSEEKCHAKPRQHHATT